MAMLPVANRIRECDSNLVPQCTSFTWRLSVKSAPEKTRYIVVGFQTEKDGDQTKNPSIFYHVDIYNDNDNKYSLLPWSYIMFIYTKQHTCNHYTIFTSWRQVQCLICQETNW